jgi:hypothetical protein
MNFAGGPLRFIDISGYGLQSFLKISTVPIFLVVIFRVEANLRKYSTAYVDKTPDPKEF